MEALIAEDAVLVSLCTALPSACAKLRKVSRRLADELSEDRLEWLLPQLFEALNLYDKNPFDLCKDGELDQVWLMIVHGLNLKARDSQGGTLLQSAIRAPLAMAKKLVTLLIERGESVNAKGANGYTPLHDICYTDSVELATLLLEKGGNVDALSINGSTPLLIAAREGRHALVNLLLRFGAEPDDGGDKGWSPLFIAAAQGHLETVRQLLDFGANPNIQLYVSLERLSNVETMRV